MPQGLAGGMVQTMLMTPIGPMIGTAGLNGMLSAEYITAAQVTRDT